MDIYRDIGRKLKTDPDYLVALSSWKSGWLDDHNAELHNLFGVTNAGGANLRYESYQAAGDDWVKRFGRYVSGSKSMDEFVGGLRKVPPNGYNTIDPNYYDKIKNQLKWAQKWEEKCLD